MHSQSLLKCWNKKQRVFCNNFSSIRVCEFRTSMVKAIKFLEDDVFIGETYDDDKYDWQCDEISESELYDVISKKIEGKEQIGVNLFYCNGTEGISLMAYNTSQTILSITINRKTVKGKYTDMSWYFENIVYKLLNADVRLLSYKIEEYED